jgi:DNA-binding Xre family transcriptional regulator
VVQAYREVYHIPKSLLDFALGTAADNRHDYSIKGFRYSHGIPRDSLWYRLSIQLRRKSLRERRVLHHWRVCKESGIDRYTFYGIMSQRLIEISPEALAILCAYLECNEEDLLGPTKKQ